VKVVSTVSTALPINHAVLHGKQSCAFDACGLEELDTRIDPVDVGLKATPHYLKYAYF
jgi:hypothetical protein